MFVNVLDRQSTVNQAASSCPLPYDFWEFCSVERFDPYVAQLAAWDELSAARDAYRGACEMFADSGAHDSLLPFVRSHLAAVRAAESRFASACAARSHAMQPVLDAAYKYNELFDYYSNPAVTVVREHVRRLPFSAGRPSPVAA